ncbi:MAG: HAMP domain-containing sensor histidine kinase, partial [Bacteroidales bacterium]
PEDKKQFGQLILQNNDILLNLINDLLDLSKIEAGYIEFNPIEVDLNNFFTDLYAMFSLRVNPGVELSCEIPDNRRIIIMDPKKLQQILNNYLSNAAKFTQKGSIRFGYKIQDNGVYFYVSDTGIGISEKNKKNVFARFQKLDSYAQGTGLGLSICKAIADAAHGKVGFNSEKGKGSTFWAWLPCEFQTKEKLNINA